MAHAAFHAMNVEARGQQVLAQMQQGLWLAICCALIGCEHALAEALHTATEAVELELAGTTNPNPATQEDIQNLISAMEASHICQHDQSDTVVSMHAARGNMPNTQQYYDPVNH